MSDKFNGFSQDDIRRLHTNPQKKTTTTTTTAAISNATTNVKPAFRAQGIRRVPDKMQVNRKPPQQKAQMLNGGGATAAAVAAARQQPKNEVKLDAGTVAANDTLDEVNLDRSMSKSLEEALFFQPIRKTSNSERQNEQKDAKTSNDSSILHLTNDTDSSESCIIFDDSTPKAMKTVSSKTSNDENGNNQNMLNLDSPFKGISLKDFESHRKMIEEQNKQKKELLHKAIEQHSQKTAAEARKIEEIKSELSKLDDDLALDVAILRKQIDMACIHFTNVEKQYMKIETQFLKAKMELHNAAEKKELLTEHLCTVIAHNEDRKSQKLSELMQKVGLSAADDYEEPASTSSNAQAVGK